MKNEFFYSQDWHTLTLNQFIDQLDSYLRWYNEKRIKVSLGGLSPLEYRLNLVWWHKAVQEKHRTPNF